jgi:hypothetical protein
MPSISVPAALIGGAAISGGASLLGANAQAQAAQQSAADQMAMFQQTQQNLKPFIQGGGTTFTNLLAQLGIGPGGTGTGTLNAPFDPSKLEQTPGFQFQLNQGNRGVLNASSATGGTRGGNTLKALSSYNQGAASTEYQQGFEDYLQQQLQNYNMQANLAGIGENAGANLGNTSATVGSNVGNAIVGAGNATSAGIVGAGNAASGLGSNYLLYSMLQNGGGNPYSNSGIADFNASQAAYTLPPGTSPFG